LLAEIYVWKGLRTGRTMYRKALELKPDHEEAARYVAENVFVFERFLDEASGLLSRLFRRI
jgi:hypothetical protein